MENIPTLKTERLILRPIQEEDVPSIYAYAKNPNVSKYTLWEPHQSVKDTEIFFRNYIYENYKKGLLEPLGVALKDNEKTVLGTVGCFWVDEKAKGMELAYSFAEEHWGKGFALEASKELVDYCFKTYGLERMQARCKKENLASRRVMEKLGMSYEGTLRSNVFHRERYWDMDYFSILRSEFNVP